MQVSVVGRCYWESLLQVIKCIVMVAWRWCWVADGGAVLLGNGSAAFHDGAVVCEMLCFTIETAVGGCEGRRCETAVAAMVAYGRLCSPIVGSVLHWEVQSQVVKRIVDGGAVLLGNGSAGFHGGVASRWC